MPQQSLIASPISRQREGGRQGLAGHGAGVRRLPGRTHPHASAPKLVDSILQVLQRARETVNAGDAHSVAPPHDSSRTCSSVRPSRRLPLALFAPITRHPDASRRKPSCSKKGPDPRQRCARRTQLQQAGWVGIHGATTRRPPCQRPLWVKSGGHASQAIYPASVSPSVSQVTCAWRSLLSHALCVGNGHLLRVGPFIIACCSAGAPESRQGKSWNRR
jgi:hypothetical protein